MSLKGVIACCCYDWLIRFDNVSEEQLKAFIAKAREDVSLQEKLKGAKSPADVVAIAKEYGHEFTTSHISQLNEEELENSSGGAEPTLSSMCAAEQCATKPISFDPFPLFTIKC